MIDEPHLTKKKGLVSLNPINRFPLFFVLNFFVVFFLLFPPVLKKKRKRNTEGYILHMSQTYVVNYTKLLAWNNLNFLNLIFTLWRRSASCFFFFLFCFVFCVCCYYFVSLFYLVFIFFSSPYGNHKWTFFFFGGGGDICLWMFSVPVVWKFFPCLVYNF